MEKYDQDRVNLSYDKIAEILGYQGIERFLKSVDVERDFYQQARKFAEAWTLPENVLLRAKRDMD